MPPVAEQNGLTPDPKQVGKAIREGERGSAIGRDDRLFDVWSEDHLTPIDVDTEKIENMLEIDGKARTLEQVLTLPLRGAAKSLDGGDDEGQALVKDALWRPANSGGMSTPIDLVVAQMTSARLFRRAYFERVYTVRDGRVVYDKIAFRPASICKLKRDKTTGAFRGFKSWVGNDHPKADEQGEVSIEPFRALVHIHGQWRKPLDGISDVSTAYNIFETKQKIRWLWASFLADQQMPKAVVKDEQDPQGLAAKFATLKGGGVIGLRPDQTAEAFESAGQGASEFMNALRYLDGEMAGSVLAGFTTLTDGAASGRGSYALSRDSTDLFLQSGEAVLGEMAATLTNFAVADLVRLNLGTRRPVPNFKFGPMVAQNVEQMLDLLKSIQSKADPLGKTFPQEFVDMLIERVADFLDLDRDRVAEALRARREDGTKPVGAEQVRHGIANAQALVEQVPQIAEAA